MLLMKLHVAAALGLSLLQTAAVVAQIAEKSDTTLNAKVPVTTAPVDPIPPTQRAGVDPAADTILDESIAELEAFRSYALHVDYRYTFLHHGGPENEQFTGWVETMDIHVDAPRWDLIDQTWDLRQGKEEPEPQFKSRTIWDGKRRIHRQQYQGPGTQPIQPSIDSKPLEIRGLAGQFLYGFAWGDRAPMVQVLRQSGRAHLRPRQEEVSGHSCSVIDADTERGSYTLWLDPSAGFQLRRAKVRRKAGDLWFDRHLPPDGTATTTTGVELDVHDLRLEKIDGHFVPMEGVQECNQILGGGNYELRREVSYSRSHGVGTTTSRGTEFSVHFSCHKPASGTCSP